MERGKTASRIEHVITPRASDIGGFQVQRALPHAKRRSVGPFVFYDQMGPAVIPAGAGLDVAPHPHIGLATITWLFEGEILHRDSVGSVQAIRPGEVNWMTAGSGVVHSERTPDTLRDAEKPLFGIQVWVALPADSEETKPAFEHHAADALPRIERDGASLELIAGSLLGARSPVTTFFEMFYAELALPAGIAFDLPAEYDDRAAHIVQGAIEVDGEGYTAGQLLVFRAGGTVSMRAVEDARLMLLGGEPLPEHRFVWWNFVSTSRERIEKAKQDWRDGRFAAVPGETGRIPLPGEQWPVVDYP